MRHRKHKKQFRTLYAPCKDKCAHKSFQGAIMACKILLREKGLHAQPYKCPSCGLYHIGKPSFSRNPMLFWENMSILMKGGK